MSRTGEYKRIDPTLKLKPHCCKCSILLSNTAPHNTSTIDINWCDGCYQKYVGLSNCCDAPIINGRCNDCKENI